MEHDPTIYLGSARHYVNGRPRYSAVLADTIRNELGLDGHGVLVDVGCGPGIVALELAHLFDEVIGVDQDAGMLAEAARQAGRRGITNVSWRQALGEDLATLGVPAPRLVTFGQSLHWMDCERVVDVVYDLLEPGGSIALIAHSIVKRPVEPPDPALPRIPHKEVEALVRSYLGPRRRAGQGLNPGEPELFEELLPRTKFGACRMVVAPGREDIVRDVDSVVDGFFSMSWCAPHLLGDRRDAFEADLRDLLLAHGPGGRFWDWPGDTDIVIGTKTLAN
ncbi:MAG: class I SAM-dependent methyltransferase [Actinobacteria bacterium]|nr:class I SAM-dependent methyltransferase [Actinomycetota bacterium]MBV9933027.1 class I SAM-dependent methyltransferase [Actinomycetota bacterium]